MKTNQQTTKTKTSLNTLTLPPFIEANAGLIKAGGALAAPRGNVAAIRKALKERVSCERNNLYNELLRKAEAVLADNEVVKNALAVHDYFANAPEGAGLCVVNTRNPCESVGEVLEELGESYKFVEISVVEDVDPVPDAENPDAPPVQPVNVIGAAVAKSGQKGVQSHVLTQIRTRSYSELVPALIKYPLLGSLPGRESIQVFVDRVVHKKDDPNSITAHTLVGAALGKRLWLDANVHIAEPMDGDRDSGGGAMGLLKGELHLMPATGQRREFREEQRATLATHGINTARAWSGVGDAVVVTNRSLQEGGRKYVSANKGRLRNWVQAIFHETAEHEILGAGQRAAGPLEKCAGLMNVFLGQLHADGWIADGKVVVDYESLIVKMRVQFDPIDPIDSILIEWH